MEEATEGIHALPPSAQDRAQPPVLTAELIGGRALFVGFRHIKGADAERDYALIIRILVDNRPAAGPDPEVNPQDEAFPNIRPSHLNSFCLSTETIIDALGRERNTCAGSRLGNHGKVVYPLEGLPLGRKAKGDSFHSIKHPPISALGDEFTSIVVTRLAAFRH